MGYPFQPYVRRLLVPTAIDLTAIGRDENVGFHGGVMASLDSGHKGVLDGHILNAEEPGKARTRHSTHCGPVLRCMLGESAHG
jgi:hypothetical protein